MVEDGLAHCHAGERSLEVDGAVAHLDGGGAVDVEAYLFEQLLGEAHHPVVVLVGHVQLHESELGVVGAVHALVAEILADFVHAVEAADNQALEV